ncbi:MAG: conjugative transfer system coupling protein TraD [Succinivibrio sp.]|nr:conjugative transfer system coupling protein TraD [Succinivibrio sp.]
MLTLLSAVIFLLLMGPSMLRSADERVKKGFIRISYAKVKKLTLRKRQTLVYLGQGYSFGPSHARRLYALMAQGSLGSSVQDFSTHGNGLIHELERHNSKPVLFLEKDLGGHTMVFGTTGSGKTRLFELLIFQALQRGDAVIVLDPKGDRDLRNRMKHACDTFRKSDFFELDVLNEYSNIVFDLLGTDEDSGQLASRLASLIEGGGSASSFKAYAHMGIKNAIDTLYLRGHRPTVDAIRTVLLNPTVYTETIYTFFRQLINREGMEEARVYYERIAGAEAENGRDRKNSGLNLYKGLYVWLRHKKLLNEREQTCLESVFGAAAYESSYYLKITAGIIPVLDSLTGRRLQKLLEPKKADFDRTVLDFARIIDKRLVFYTALHCLSDSVSGSNLGRLMLSSLASVAGRIYAAGKSQSRVSIFVDEASELVSEEMLQLLNKSRGAGFAMTLATQTAADFAARSGSERMIAQIIGNCNNLISLRSKDLESARIIASTLPKTTVATLSSSVTLAENVKAHLGISESVSRSVSMRECPLFPAEALMQLPDLEYVASLADGRFIKGKIPFLYAP